MGDFTRALLTRGGPKSRAQVRAALERFAGGIALVPARKGEPADREMVIADGRGGWTLVIDSSGDLEPMALSIGAALGTTTVTCALYDGDTTELSLYADGKRIAGVATGENAKIVRRRAWADALGPGISLERFYEELERLRDEGDAIDELAPLLGCAASALRGLEPDIGAITRLRFRLRERPRWEKAGEGPGRLDELMPTRVSASLLVGQRHRVMLGGNNRGGAFRGLRIEIGGDAIARGLLVPTVVRVDVAVNRDGGQRIELPPPASESERVVAIADVIVSAGRVERPTSSELREPGAKLAFHAGHLELFVDAVARAPGTGNLRVTCYPSAEAGSGGVVHEGLIIVEPAAWRPLRAESDEHTPAFDVLASERFTSAVVVYDCARDVAAEHARELFAVAFAEHRSRRLEGRTIDEYSASTRFDADRTDALAEAMRNARIVAVEPTTPSAINPFASEMTAEPSAWFGAPVAGDDPSAPTAVVSVPFGKARDALHAAIERGVASGLILQATLGSWGQAPSVVGTPYEKAVGIEGKDATRRSWVTRYLRAVGDDMVWIGAPMITHLPESARSALERGATACETLASGALVVTVGGREMRPAVENTLEALLPSAADFKAFRTAVWGR